MSVFDKRWRVGRKLGRTIYAMDLLVPSDTDTVLGMVDTVELAAHIVAVHNAAMTRPGAGPSGWASGHGWVPGNE